MGGALTDHYMEEYDGPEDNLETHGDMEDDEDEEGGRGQTPVLRVLRGRAGAAAAALFVVAVLCDPARLVGGVALPRAAPVRGRIVRLAAAPALLARLRGGHAEAPAGDAEPPSDNVEEESSCEWFKPHKGPGAPNPRLDTEHAPWLDAYRQVYFKSNPKPNP